MIYAYSVARSHKPFANQRKVHLRTLPPPLFKRSQAFKMDAVQLPVSREGSA